MIAAAMLALSVVEGLVLSVCLAQATPTDLSRRPNWIPATYAFGSCGSDAGQLREPAALAFGAGDALYVADSGNHRIQVFHVDGRRSGGWGKEGAGDGEFLFPEGIAVSADAEVYVADTGNHRIQVFSASGAFLRSWGTRGVGPGEFSRPRGIAVALGQVYVADADHPRIQVFTSKGGHVRSIQGFAEPGGLAIDDEGVVFAADAGAHRLRVFGATGESLREWGTWGSHEGMLARPAGLALRGDLLYLADEANHRVQVFDRSGAFLYQWGRAPAFAHEGNGRFHFPSGIAVSRSGGFTAVCEPVEHRVQVFANGAARTPKPVSDQPWWDSLHARFHSAPASVPAADRKPSAIWITPEPESHSVLFFDVGQPIPVFAARAGGYGSRLGEFSSPSGAAFGGDSLVATISDRGNRRLQTIQLLRDAGSPTGFAPAARVILGWDLAAVLAPLPEGVLLERCRPGAVAFRGSRELLLVDEGNSVVFVLDPGMKLLSVLRPPKGAPSRFVDVAVSPGRGTVYVADRYRSQVLSFDAGGKALDAWGSRSATGDLGFLSPSGLAVDAEERVYVSDALLHRVRKLDAKGALLVKWGSFGREPGELWGPRSISVIGRDRIVVDDAGNHRGQLYTTAGQQLDTVYKGGFLPPPAPSK